MIYKGQIDLDQFKSLVKSAGIGDDLRNHEDIEYSTVMTVSKRIRSEGGYGKNKYLPLLVRMSFANGKMLECFDLADLEGDVLRRYINFLGGYKALGKELGVATPYQWMSRGFRPGKAKQEKLAELFEARMRWLRSLYFQLPTEHTETKGLTREVSRDQFVEIITKLRSNEVAETLSISRSTVTTWRCNMKDQKRRLPKNEIRVLLRDILIDTYEEAIANPFPCDDLMPMRQHFGLTGMKAKEFAQEQDIVATTFGVRLSGYSAPHFGDEIIDIINEKIRIEYNDFLLRNVRGRDDQ